MKPGRKFTNTAFLGHGCAKNSSNRRPRLNHNSSSHQIGADPENISCQSSWGPDSKRFSQLCVCVCVFLFLYLPIKKAHKMLPKPRFGKPGIGNSAGSIEVDWLEYRIWGFQKWGVKQVIGLVEVGSPPPLRKSVTLVWSDFVQFSLGGTKICGGIHFMDIWAFLTQRCLHVEVSALVRNTQNLESAVASKQQTCDTEVTNTIHICVNSPAVEVSTLSKNISFYSSWQL